MNRLFTGIQGGVWAKICLLNLTIVACLGLLMRLNILVSIPGLDQGFTLHAHSHFAFSGWISQALFLCIAQAVTGRGFGQALPARYGRLLAFNLFCSYGMLVSFMIQGYAAVSIFFSTLSILASYIFYALCRKDVTQAQRQEVWWKYLHFAMLCGMFSALGTFVLAYTMAARPGDIEWRLSSVYFYLHFQYNGWFFLACMGLFHYWLAGRNIVLPSLGTVFRLMSSCVVPAYLLSINWLPFPDYLHAFTMLFAVVQLGGWVLFLTSLWRSGKSIAAGLSPAMRALLGAVILAASIKLVLQTASSIPAVATLAFGLRPVVIAYLHLVLLGIISLFLVGWFYKHHVLPDNPLSRKGIVIFTSGIIANEMCLAVQGISAICGFYVGYMPEALAAAGLALVSGSWVMFQSAGRKEAVAASSF